MLTVEIFTCFIYYFAKMGIFLEQILRKLILANYLPMFLYGMDAKYLKVDKS